MGKRSAVVELFLGDMGSMQRELRPSTQREDQLTMETKLEQIAVKAVNQLPKSVVREIRTPRSVGAGGGRPPPATRWDGNRSVAEWPKLPRPSSTLPFRTSQEVSARYRASLIDAIAHQAASAKLPEVIDFYLRAVSRSRKTSSARLSALSPK